MSTYGMARFDPYSLEPRTLNLTAATAFRQVDQLTGDVVRLTRERDDAVASRDAARADMRDVTNALQSVNCQCEELAEENAQLRCHLDEFKHLADDFERMAAVTEALAEADKQGLAERQQLLAERQQLKARIAELKAERNDLQAQAARP